jgi:GTP-binding protein HflX
VRVLVPRTEPPILISDTVGFIKKLPHDLVASFRSTLDEAREADLLLHVVDAADAAFRAHIEVTRQVLGELGIDHPQWVLLNKIDLVGPDERQALALELPDAIQLSTRHRDDVAALREQIIGHFLGALEEAAIVVPWAQAGLVHKVHEQCRVLAESHEEDGTHLTVRAPRAVIDRLVADLAAT